MDYGNLLNRAWTIMWNHKYLIVLGVVAGLSGGGGSSSSSVNYQINGNDLHNMPNLLPAQFDAAWSAAAIVAIVAIVALIAVMLVFFLLVWALSMMAQGALIAGVDMIETGRPSSLGIAWQAGWRRVWTLLGIGLVPLIPMLLVAGATLSAGIMLFGVGAYFGDTTAFRTAGMGIVSVIVAVLCLLLPIMLFIGLWSNLAYRACMLEQTGVWASYRRGWEVLGNNLGSVLVLALLQFVIQIGLAVALFIPSFIMVVCCILWPLLLLIQGVITSYFSTVWTLAWREWTAAPPASAPIAPA